MENKSIDTWYYDRVRAYRRDFAAENITAITVIRSRPPLLIAVLLWLLQKLKP